MQFAHNGYYKGSTPLGLNLYSAVTLTPSVTSTGEYARNNRHW
jgi:hypothetical protein